MPTVYQVPLLLEEQKLISLLRARLNLGVVSIPFPRVAKGSELWETWKAVVTQDHEASIEIALVGKYVECHDAYLSVVKSLEHSSMHLRRKLNLTWVDAEHLEPQTKTSKIENYNKAWKALEVASGIIVPGGFGLRGTEGMMLASKFARESKKPFLGVSQRLLLVAFASRGTDQNYRFVSGSKLPRFNSRAIFATCRAPTPRNSTLPRATALSSPCLSWTRRTWEEPCASDLERPSSSQTATGPRSVHFTAGSTRSRSDTVTDTRSTPHTSIAWMALVYTLLGRTRLANVWKSLSSRIIHTLSVSAEFPLLNAMLLSC